MNNYTKTWAQRNKEENSYDLQMYWGSLVLGLWGILIIALSVLSN